MTLKELYGQIGGDYDAALRIMMMESLAGRMIVKFAEDSTFEKLMAAGAAMDAGGIFHGAHALKGVAANLGLTSLSRQASVLCEEFRPEHERTMNDEEVQARLQDLKKTYDQILAGIQAYQS